MAVTLSVPSTTASNAPGPAISRQGPNVLRKSPSLAVPRPPPAISRRHSWTSSRDQRSRDPSPFSPAIMDGTEVKLPSTSHGLPQMTDSLLSNKRVFSTTRPGATFDMAYYIRHTGPPASATPAPGRDLAQEEPRRAGRKKSRGGLFKKRRESPDLVAPTADEERKQPIFVPPEGVEQKVTARGNKYLQIVPHPDLIDLGRVYASQPYCGPDQQHAEAVSSEALDTWISSLSLRNEDGTDLSVRPPTFADMRAHESAETLPGSREGTRSPLSFVSQARSMIPSARDGFGLSIVDGPTMRPYFNGASNPNEALCSNPPSDPGTPPRAMHAHNASIETAETPLLDIQRLEPVDSETIAHLPDFSRFEKAGEKEKLDRRSADVLAGQGLRRPGRDEIVLTQTGSSSPDIYPAAAVQSRRNRDAKVRARKIRELQRASKAMNDMAKDNAQRLQQSALIDELDDVFNVSSPVTSSPASAVPPPRHQNRLTKTMIVAEQAPLPRGRPLRKPARLVLRDRSTSQKRTAVRQEESDGSPEAKQLQKPCTPPQTAPSLPPKSSNRNTPTTTSFFTPNSYAKHHSTPLLSMSAIAPQAVTVTSSYAGGIRASLCSSSHTSTSKEARLEARLEAVERENRLLEAALMAVLKTSGTLNRCPCVLLKERTDATKSTEQLPSLKPAALAPTPGSRATTPLPVPPKGQASELQRVSEEISSAARKEGEVAGSSASSTHTRRGSWDSNGSGISALEVYLRTKIGA